MSHLYKAIPLKRKDSISYEGYEVKYGLFGFEYSNGIQMGMISGFDLDKVFEKIDEILKSKNN